MELPLHRFPPTSTCAVSVRNFLGQTALHVFAGCANFPSSSAVSHRKQPQTPRVQAVQILLAATAAAGGADAGAAAVQSLVNARDNEGRTALMMVCRFGKPNKDPSNSRRQQPTSASWAQLSIARLLLKDGADRALRDNQGKKAMDHLRREDQGEPARELRRLLRERPEWVNRDRPRAMLSLCDRIRESSDE